MLAEASHLRARDRKEASMVAFIIAAGALLIAMISCGLLDPNQRGRGEA